MFIKSVEDRVSYLKPNRTGNILIFKQSFPDKLNITKILIKTHIHYIILT